MFLTDADIGAALAHTLKKADYAALQAAAAFWTEIVTNSHESGYKDVYTALVNRGFTAAQIAQWDDGARYELDQSLFWCLIRGGSLHNYDPKLLSNLDRRKELASMRQLVISGVWQGPSLTTPGLIMGGETRLGTGVFPIPTGGTGCSSDC